MVPKNVNKTSRVYFHRVVKTNRFATLQERRFNLGSTNSEEQIMDKLIKKLLENLQINQH